MNRFSRKQIVVAAFVLAFTGFAGGGSAQKRSPVAPRGKKVACVNGWEQEYERKQCDWVLGQRCAWAPETSEISEAEFIT